MVDTAGAVLHDGAIGYLNFTGKSGCVLADSWTALTFSNVSLKTHNDVTVAYDTPVDGKLIVVPDKDPGDCNSDGNVNAADFSATAREIWDVESEDSGTQDLNPNSWLWSPLGSYHGSAKGCDSNEDRTVAVSDILCTARRFFGASSCGASVAAAASAPAVVAAPAAVLASANASVDVPISLETAGSNVAALAFAMNFDPTQFTFDATDADQDGVPDAVTLNVPPSMLRMVDVTSGKLNIMVAGIAMPMPELSDGIVASIQLVGSAQASGALAPVTLTDVSLGDAEGGAVPAEVVSLAPEGLIPGIFLPMITR